MTSVGLLGLFQFSLVRFTLRFRLFGRSWVRLLFCSYWVRSVVGRVSRIWLSSVLGGVHLFPPGLIQGDAAAGYVAVTHRAMFHRLRLGAASNVACLRLILCVVTVTVDWLIRPSLHLFPNFLAWRTVCLPQASPRKNPVITRTTGFYKKLWLAPAAGGTTKQRPILADQSCVYWNVSL